MKHSQTRVMIVDDSALVREILTKILSSDPDLLVVGKANDPVMAIQKLKTLKPDVITLDLEMPRMDGMTFLRKLMAVYPLPVVIVSSRAEQGGAVALQALELGAVDIITKPSLSVSHGLGHIQAEIINKVKAAAKVNMEPLRRLARQQRKDTNQGEVPAAKVQKLNPAVITSTDTMIAIGASTGGTVAVKEILMKLPANLPGIIVVLHMPPGFTHSYAQGLDQVCPMRVKEAENGELITQGTIYIAPGGIHTIVAKKKAGFIIQLEDSERFNHHKPSVDLTFQSLAATAKHNSIGILLTGMGGDGAEGLKAMHDEGAFTIAQDEATSVVFGMPKKAIELGAVDIVAPIGQIHQHVLKGLNK